MSVIEVIFIFQALGLFCLSFLYSSTFEPEASFTLLAKIITFIFLIDLISTKC
jgi:hypothetical protein